MAQKKTILVTGGAGFIGSHLCNRLKTEDCRVISLDNYFTGSRDNHISGVEYREGHTKDIEKHVPETPDIISASIRVWKKVWENPRSYGTSTSRVPSA